MSAGPQLDGSDGGDDPDRQERVRDAVDQFQREQVRADVGSVQVDDMLPDDGQDPRREPEPEPEQDDTTDSRSETTARPTTGTPGGDTSTESDGEQGTAPDAEDVDDGSGQPEQGIEESGATESVEQQAQELEQTVIENNPELTEEDVSVSLVGGEEGARLEAELTEGAANRVQGRIQQALAGLGFEGVGTGAVRGPDSADRRTGAEQEADAEVRGALEGIGAFEERAEQQQEQVEQIEQELERQIGEQRAAVLGAVDPAQARQQIERTDLERGEDFVIETGEPETRTFTDPETGEQVTETITPIEASLTGNFEQQFLEELTGFELARQFGATFEPGEEFELVETEEGLQPELTDEGAAKAQTQNIRRAVADLEARVFGVPGTQFQIDIPGEGPLIETTEQQDLGTGAESIKVRAGPEDEFMTLQEAIQGGVDIITEATEVSEEAPIEAAEPRRGRAGAAARQEQAFFTGAGRQPVAQASSSILRTPAFILEGVNLGIDAAEFGGELAGAADAQVGRSGVGVTFDEERINELFGNLETAAAQRAALTGEAIAEDPGEFGARAVGSIIGTGGLFGAAGAAGRVPSGVARGLIQPGEEIAGVGLNVGARSAGRAIGRPDAGRRLAETIAPQNEPIFLSEEFAIRTGRRAAGKTREIINEGRNTLARIQVQPRVGAGLVPPRLRFEAEGNEPTVITAEDLSSERALAELEEEIHDGVTSVPRKPERAGLGPQGEFRGSFTRQQDPAFGGSGKPNLGAERDFEGLRETLGFEDTESPRTLLTAEELRAQLGFETEAATETRGIFGFDAEQAGTARAESAVAAEERLNEAMAQSIAEEVSGAAEARREGAAERELTVEGIDTEIVDRLDMGLDQEIRGDTDTLLEGRQESRQETRSETEIDQELRQVEQDIVTEAEAEGRSEARAEFRRDSEAETEAETRLFDERLLEDEEEFLKNWIGEERFESGLADAEQLEEQGLIRAFEEAEESGLDPEDIESIERDILEDG